VSVAAFAVGDEHPPRPEWSAGPRRPDQRRPAAAVVAFTPGRQDPGHGVGGDGAAGVQVGEEPVAGSAIRAKETVRSTTGGEDVEVGMSR